VLSDFADDDAVRAHLAEVVPLKVAQAQAEKPPRKLIRATPFVYRDPSTIPPREVVYGRHFVRKFLSATVAPGGLGKSSLALVEAIAMATGRDLLGVPARDPLTVWYWGGEDPFDEIERRVGAILLHYNIKADELGGRLFLDSGRDCEIVVATESRDGAMVAEPVVEDLEATILESKIDVWMFDPFVSCHALSENDNNKIGVLMKTLAGLADRTNTAGELVHHVRKNSTGGETTVEDGRGAKAFSDRCRSVRTLNMMSDKEATEFGVDPDERYRTFRVDIGKSNMFAPARQAVWRRLVTVPLHNGPDGSRGDHIGVVSRWKAPDLFEGVSPTDVLRVQQEINTTDDWRESSQATRWVGQAVASVLGLDLEDATAKTRVKEMLKVWLKSDLLQVVERTDSSRQVRKFVSVQKWIEP
jgi:hypothetical protein